MRIDKPPSAPADTTNLSNDGLFEVHVLIEISKDNIIKYEMDVKNGVIVVDRLLTVSMAYPCNYRYILMTRR